MESTCESFSSLRMDVCVVCGWVGVQQCMQQSCSASFMLDSFLKSSKRDSHLGLDVHRHELVSRHANSAFRFCRWPLASPLQVREIHSSQRREQRESFGIIASTG